MRVIIETCISCGWEHENPKFFISEAGEVYYICLMTREKITQKGAGTWERTGETIKPYKH